MEASFAFIDTALGLSATKAEQLSAAQVCLRAWVVFFILVAYVRFAKKRFLGEATGLDAIIVIVIGSISSRAISGTAPFLSSLAGTLMLILAHWIVSYFTRDSKMLSFIMMGRDTVLVRNGKVDRKALRAAHMSEEDLLEDLRQKGVESVAEVKIARLERSGDLSAIKAPKKKAR